ncbi:hypothetical protein PMZ80_003259 [Knufia obscura]|uniref:Uncharacterized protein n=2 Tax=Knufia TaxID=430999 RepID=A0AAN8I5G6_9EURO|nr:hypothetical protein PMZ80_003259 [Knufia obscura]KAK5950376.1 hypothetical protein OHC33_008595 [Knufia fluminis]
MANHARAARALLFMQQCRQQARTQGPLRLTAQPSRDINSSSLDPENFGKKMRLTPNPIDPIPEWRLQASQTQTQPNTLQSQLSSTAPASSTEPPIHHAPTSFPRSRDQPIPRYRHNPAVPAGFLSFLKYRILRIPEPPNPHDTAKPSFNVLTNPYHARKQWPPILSHMSELQQFHYEKKFRRRLLRKTYALRTNWDRWALFLRRASIGGILFYFAFVADPRDPNHRVPPDGLRYWLYGKLRRGNGEELGGEGAQFWPRRLGGWIESQYQHYKRKHKRQWDPYNHEGWDERRPRNSLPAMASPNVNRPLGDPTGVIE